MKNQEENNLYLKMQTGTISFCDDSAMNIKSTSIKTIILNKLENDFGVKIISKHHDKFDISTSINRIKQNPYMICLKSNGNPYYMYLTRHNNVNLTLMIDKKVQQGYFLPRMIIVRKGFDNHLFTNTLFDGEMIKTSDNKWIYMINDILVCKNKQLSSLNFMKRINLVYDILENDYKSYPFNIFNIQVKKYVKYIDLENVLLPLKDKLNYTNRGLLFKPMFTKFKDILLNFDDSLIDNSKKIKYANTKDNTYIDIKELERIKRKNEYFDEYSSNGSKKNINHMSNNNLHMDKLFNVLKTDLPDIYELYDDENKNCGIACVSTLKCSKYLEEKFKDTSINQKIKLLCKYNDKFANNWVPIVS